jgi:hypothetical protein
LRFEREQAIKLRLDICGERTAVVYPYEDEFAVEDEERFDSDNVKYVINGNEYKNIYGLTVSSKKYGGTKTEIWIKRSLESGSEIPDVIEKLIITAKLYRTQYERRHFGTFIITLEKLVLILDETSVNTSDAVIGPLRYYVSGQVSADVFSSTERIV